LTLVFGGVALVGGFVVSATLPGTRWEDLIGVLVASGCIGAAIGGHRGGSKEYVWGFVLGMFITTGGWIIIAWITRPRISPGHCRECGYDLTGNVTGVCSECGVKVEG